jgi:hypothetical protein
MLRMKLSEPVTHPASKDPPSEAASGWGETSKE